MLATYLLSAFFSDRWLGALEIGLFTIAGLLALRNSPARSRLRRSAITAGLLGSAVMIFISASFDSSAGHGTASIWTSLLLLITVTVLLRQILLMPSVTIQSIYGVVSGYLIIGLMYAAFYSAIYYFHGHHFFAHRQPGTASTFQYFSFTTLTTLGYGDFTATVTAGRSFAVLEAMTGQIFLATLVARLVAAFRPQAGRAGAGSADENLPRVFNRA